MSIRSTAVCTVYEVRRMEAEEREGKGCSVGTQKRKRESSGLS